MERDININLYISASHLPPQLLQLEKQLQTISYILIVCVLLAASFLLSGTYILQKNLNTITSQKEELFTQIKSQSHKEGLYMAIRSRIGVVRKVLDSHKPWSQFVAHIESILNEKNIERISNIEKDKFIFSLKADSLTETADIINGFIQLASDGKVSNPVLDSLKIMEDGEISLSISLSYVF